MFKIEDIQKSIDALHKSRTERGIYVFMGSYANVNGTATLTYSSDSSYVYRKYRDIETDDTLTINKAAVAAFEKEHDIIYTVVDDYTQEEYEETYKVIKKTYMDKLSSSNKEEAFKLIKRLTPLQ